MRIKNNSAIIPTTVICLLPIALAVVLYEKLPEQIPIHFNSSGEADNYWPKAAAAFGLPVGMALINLFVHFMLDNDPKKAGASAAVKSLSKWIVPITSIIAVPMSLFISMGYNVPIHVIVPALTGVLFMFCGNYLPKSRQNYTVGIKLPWTLNDEDNWNKTHRLAGILWIAGGFIITAGSLLQFGGVLLIVAVTAVLIFVPFVYSFALYKGGK